MEGAEEAVEPAEALADVGGDEKGEEVVEGEEDAEGFLGEAEEKGWQDAAAVGEGRVDGVHAGGGEPVEVLAAGVHGVEAPERRHGVRPTVGPVRADVRHENRGEKRHPAGPGGDRLLQRWADENAQPLRGDDGGDGDEEFAEAAAAEERARSVRTPGRCQNLRCTRGNSDSSGTKIANSTPRPSARLGGRRDQPRAEGRAGQRGRLLVKKNWVESLR